MKIVNPSFEILDAVDGAAMLRKIEAAARTCYKSEDKITADSAEAMVRNLIKRGHETPLEHEKISVRIICDRGVSHELVRHRIASYSQESTRYCNYSQGRFGGELAFIRPCFWEPGSDAYQVWENAMHKAENYYFALRCRGATPQEARAVLPNSLKTEIVVTMNLREWRHFFRLRAAPDAHPQMREIASAMLANFKERVPVVFDDLGELL
ncbi:MAG: FAD-dependent thymidylate synthase [Selenomonadaceae bacterium]|nr:FAD-dependent thymidylate synthase [Selenomonadaceae bacterium]